MFAPFILLGGYKLMIRLRLDDLKVVPLTLGPGIYSALMAAVLAGGVKQGGYFGITQGEYASSTPRSTSDINYTELSFSWRSVSRRLFSWSSWSRRPSGCVTGESMKAWRRNWIAQSLARLHILTGHLQGYNKRTYPTNRLPRSA